VLREDCWSHWFMLKDKLSCRGIVFFGVTEVLIGCVTLMAVTLSVFRGESEKPPEVLLFVLTTAMISLSLGIGVLRRSLHSYHLLLFFSTVIILSKILIFAKIIYLSGALETTVPSSVKNFISIVYHGVLVIYFVQPAVRKQFKEKTSPC
jgi:hypothetical protein